MPLAVSFYYQKSTFAKKRRKKKFFVPFGIWTRGPLNMSKQSYLLSYRDIHTNSRLDVINKVHEKVASGSSSRFQQKLRYTPYLGCWPGQNLVFHWILTGPDQWEIDIKDHYILASPKLRKLSNFSILSVLARLTFSDFWNQFPTDQGQSGSNAISNFVHINMLNKVYTLTFAGNCRKLH